MKSRFTLLSVVLASGMLLGGVAQASDRVVGAVFGAGAGALVGNALGGRDGAIIGGALGAATGASLASDHRRGHGGGYDARPIYQAQPVYYAQPQQYYAQPQQYYAPPQQRYYAPIAEMEFSPGRVYYPAHAVAVPQRVYYVPAYRERDHDRRHWKHHRYDRDHDHDWDNRRNGRGTDWNNRHRD